MPAAYEIHVDENGTDRPVTINDAWSTKDKSPPLTALAHIGDDINPDEDSVIAPASGRIKVEVTHAGDDGRLWIGVGQTAQAGVGNYLDPGDVWAEFNAQDIHVLLVDASGAQRITGMEWAA